MASEMVSDLAKQMGDEINDAMSTVKLQIQIAEMLGEQARTYVLDKYPDAVACHVNNTKGERESVGIFRTNGIDLTHKLNYAKDQYSPQLVGVLVPYHNLPGIGSADHFAEAWIVASIAVRKYFNKAPSGYDSQYFLELTESWMREDCPCWSFYRRMGRF